MKVRKGLKDLAVTTKGAGKKLPGRMGIKSAIKKRAASIDSRMYAVASKNKPKAQYHQSRVDRAKAFLTAKKTGNKTAGMRAKKSLMADKVSLNAGNNVRSMKNQSASSVARRMVKPRRF